MKEKQVSDIIVSIVEKYNNFNISYLQLNDAKEMDIVFIFKLHGKENVLKPSLIENYIVNINNEDKVNDETDLSQWCLAVHP